MCKFEDYKIETEEADGKVIAWISEMSEIKTVRPSKEKAIRRLKVLFEKARINPHTKSWTMPQKISNEFMREVGEAVARDLKEIPKGLSGCTCDTSIPCLLHAPRYS